MVPPGRKEEHIIVEAYELVKYCFVDLKMVPFKDIDCNIPP
jgi:hypothetical protein